MGETVRSTPDDEPQVNRTENTDRIDRTSGNIESAL
jgi:hypothetical protein